MDSIISQILVALWLGILTSINPCPLTTNIAAISFISKDATNAGKTIMAGVFYALGRAFTYSLLALIIVAGLFRVPAVSLFLQTYVSKLLGPLLVLVGMILAGLLNAPGIGGGGIVQRIGGRLKAKNIISAFLFGILFALAFCPTSAVIFFGSLIPIVYKYDSSVAIPTMYGLGTALPVIVFSIVLSVSTASVSRYYDCVVKFERYARAATGVVLILIGIFLSVQNMI